MIGTTTVRNVAVIAGAFGAGTMVANAMAITATTSGPGPRYTARERIKLNNHHCKSEDAFMFIPSTRIMDGVNLGSQSHDKVYCVQIDYPYLAPRNN